MPPLKKFQPESIRGSARNPNIDLKSIGFPFRSDIQQQIQTQRFQELLTKMDTIQRHSIDQNLRKLAETAGFSDIYAQEYNFPKVSNTKHILTRKSTILKIFHQFLTSVL